MPAGSSLSDNNHLMVHDVDLTAADSAEKQPNSTEYLKEWLFFIQNGWNMVIIKGLL